VEELLTLQEGEADDLVEVVEEDHRRAGERDVDEDDGGQIRAWASVAVVLRLYIGRREWLGDGFQGEDPCDGENAHTEYCVHDARDDVVGYPGETLIWGPGVDRGEGDGVIAGLS